MKLSIVIAILLKLCHGNNINYIGVNDTETRILGGTAAKYKGTEYQVSIRLKLYEKQFGFGQGHICGGTIISLTRIITAAHCLFYIDEDKHKKYLRYAKEFIIVAGILNRFDRSNAIQRNVQSFMYHKDFSLDTMQNDLAIMFLKQEIPSGLKHVRPIEINRGLIKEGETNCTISGWGKTRFGGQVSNVLLIANVKIVNQNKCASNYKRYLNMKIKLGMMFCAGNDYGTVDSCQGDSGGPLICLNRLSGVVSWGYKCGEIGFPGIYTNISYYLSWINNGNPLQANSPNGASTNFPQKIFLSIFICLIFNMYRK